MQWWCSVLWKYPFQTKLIEKIKIVSLSWNFVPRLIWICRIQWSLSRFLFSTRNQLLGKLGPKNQNCQFKPKIGTQTSSNTKNLMMMFIFSVFDPKYRFFVVNLVQNIKIVGWSCNFAPRLIRICRIQWWSSFFFRFRLRTHFLG